LDSKGVQHLGVWHIFKPYTITSRSLATEFTAGEIKIITGTLRVVVIPLFD
jgi:hypothetical protein